MTNGEMFKEVFGYDLFCKEYEDCEITMEDALDIIDNAVKEYTHEPT